jgi:hypothetical protein
MKLRLDVECTPDEARQCLGLPNIAALQDRMLERIEAKMLENLSYLDPETLMKTWLPIPTQSWSEMQNFFWSQMGVKPSAKQD